jgi:hypothetical protein
MFDGKPLKAHVIFLGGRVARMRKSITPKAQTVVAAQNGVNALTSSVPVAPDKAFRTAGIMVALGYHKAALDTIAMDCSKADSFIRLMTAAA